MTQPYHLFNLFGIPVRAAPSLFALLFLVVAGVKEPVTGLGVGLALFASLLLHEFGHVLAARAFGCRAGDITLSLLGGRATLSGPPLKPGQEALTALAGPLVSLALAAAGLLLPDAHVSGRTLVAGSQLDYLFMCAGTLNAFVFAFNLLPAFPLDGGQLLRALLQRTVTTRVKATWITARCGRFVALLVGVSALYSWLAGAFQAFMLLRLLLAFALYRAADREYRQALDESGAGRGGPFAGFPFFGRTARTPPPDDGQAVVSPPPYERRGATRVEVKKES